jgi:hypothetical protein
VCDDGEGMSRSSVSTEVPDTPPVTIPPLTVTGIREMVQARLEKLHKPRLIKGITACMALIDLLESGGSEVSKVRSELKELKLSVFTNASATTATSTVNAVTQDTQDFLDRPNIGWDAIHKLAKEQNPTAFTATPNAVKDTPPSPSRRGERHRGAGQAAQAGEVHGPVVLVVFCAGDTGGQGQAEEGLSAQPPGGGLHGRQLM